MAWQAVKREVAMQSYNKVTIGKPEEWEGWNAMSELLGLTCMGLTIASFEPGKGYEQTHSHERQEEVYILIAGRGQMRVDDELLDVFPGDMIRVSPAAKRALRSTGESSSTWLMIGAMPGDYTSEDYTLQPGPAFPPHLKNSRPG